MQDNHFDWMRKKVFIDPLRFSFIEATNVLQSALDSTVVPAEAGALGVAGLLMTGSADAVGLIWPLPYDLDPKFDIGFRVHFSIDCNGAPTNLWTITQKLIKRGEAISLVNANITKTLPLVGNLDENETASTTDWLRQVTPRGYQSFLGTSLDRDDIEDGACLGMKVIHSGLAINTTTLLFLGLEIDYVPHRCIGNGNASDRPLTADART